MNNETVRLMTESALDAWQIGLRTDVSSAQRTLGGGSTAHNPMSWIKVTGDSCSGTGVPTSLENSCPFSGSTIGVCETRFYIASGQIVDTTAPHWCALHIYKGARPPRQRHPYSRMKSGIVWA